MRASLQKLYIINHVIKELIMHLSHFHVIAQFPPGAAAVSPLRSVAASKTFDLSVAPLACESFNFALVNYIYSIDISAVPMVR